MLFSSRLWGVDGGVNPLGEFLESRVATVFDVAGCCYCIDGTGFGAAKINNKPLLYKMLV